MKSFKSIGRKKVKYIKKKGKKSDPVKKQKLSDFELSKQALLKELNNNHKSERLVAKFVKTFTEAFEDVRRYQLKNQEVLQIFNIKGNSGNLL